MNHGRAIATNTALMMGGKIFTTILSLVLTATLARSLGVFGYGEFTTAFAFLTFFGVFADFGFFQIFVRELARRPEDEQSITNNILTLRSLFAFVIYALAAVVVWFSPYSLTVKHGVMILALASFFLSINTTLIGVFQAHQTMIKAVVGDVVGRIVLLVVVLFGLRAGWNLESILAVYLLANMLNLLITIGFVHRRLPLRLRFDLPMWRMLFTQAWPLGVVTMLGILYFRIDTIILSILKSPIEVGIYGAPYKIFELLTVVPAIFMGNVFPILTRLVTTDRAQATRLIQGAFDALVISALGIATALIAASSGIIQLVAGREFVTATTVTIAGQPITAVTVLAILAVALVAIFLGNLWSPIVIALGHQRTLILPGIIAVVVNIVLNLLLIPRYGYFAAAVVTVLTELFIAIAWGWIAYRYLPFRLEFTRVREAIFAATITFVVMWLLRDQSVFVALAAGGFVYAGLLWMRGAIPSEVLSYLRRDRSSSEVA